MGQWARSGGWHTNLATRSRLRKESLHTKLTLHEQHDVRMNVREKVQFFNVGEWDHGQYSGGEPGRNSHAIDAHELERLVAQKNNCVCTCSKLNGQVILQGTTDAVVLCVALPNNVRVDCPKSHCSSMDTSIAMRSFA